MCSGLYWRGRPHGPWLFFYGVDSPLYWGVCFESGLPSSPFFLFDVAEGRIRQVIIVRPHTPLIITDIYSWRCYVGRALASDRTTLLPPGATSVHQRHLILSSGSAVYRFEVASNESYECRFARRDGTLVHETTTRIIEVKNPIPRDSPSACTLENCACGTLLGEVLSLLA